MNFDRINRMGRMNNKDAVFSFFVLFVVRISVKPIQSGFGGTSPYLILCSLLIMNSLHH